MALAPLLPPSRQPKNPGLAPFGSNPAPSILSQAGRTALSGAAVIGNTLNKPSRALWGSLNYLAGGHSGGGLANLLPFSDTLGITNPDEGIEASKFFENRGWLPKNKEGLDWYDPVRVGLDIAGDPLSYVSPLALTKTGTAASKAGTLSKGFANQIARGERGLIGLQAPLGRTLATVGHGKNALRVGKALDKSIDKLAYGNLPFTTYSPGRHLSQLFDARAGGDGVYDATVQRVARDLHSQKNARRQKVYEEVMPLTTANARNKTFRYVDSQRQHRLMEEASDRAKGPFERIQAANLKEMNARQFAEEQASAMKTTGQLHDIVTMPEGIRKSIPYTARSADFGGQRGAAVRDLFDTRSSMDSARNEALKGFRRGTGSVNQFFTDEKLMNRIPHQAELLEGKARRSAINNLAADIAHRWGKHIEPTFIKGDAGIYKNTRKPVIASTDRAFVKHAHAADDDVLVLVDPAKLDANWKATGGTNYLGPNDHGIDSRLAGATNFLATGEPVQASRIHFDPTTGKVEFIDGRHRYAAMRNAGENSIGVTVSKDQAKAVRDAFGTDIPKESIKSRYKAQARFLIDHPEVRNKPMYNAHPLVDATNRLISGSDRLQSANIAEESLRRLYQADMEKQAPQVVGVPKTEQAAFPKSLEWIAKKLPPVNPSVPLTHTYGGVAKNLNLDPIKMTRNILGPDVFDAMSNADKATAVEKMMGRGVTAETATSLKNLHTRFDAPEAASRLWNGVKSFNALFKAGVLTNPSRYVRDAVSGTARNIREGAFSATAAKATRNVLGGRGDESLMKIPAVADWLDRTARPHTAENAADAVREMYATYGASPPIMRDNLGSLDASFKDLTEHLPGLEGKSIRKQLGEAFRKATLRDKSVPLSQQTNPLNVRGFNGKTESTFGPVAAGDVVGGLSDRFNRMTPFMERLRQGFSPAEAMRRTNRAQVDYSPDSITNFERGLAQLFPFYRFSRGNIPYVASELASNPGGRLGQSIKTVGNAQTQDPLTPEHVASQTAIPLGTAADGTQRFLTGLGLMHEDALPFAGGGVRGALMEGVGRMTPAVKAPLEWATGRSFFQRGIDGGRPLDEMDPTIGRTLANLGQATGLRTSKDPVRFPGSGPLEFALANSPISRLLTTARQITDVRPTATIGKKTLNLLTGTRITDVTTTQREMNARELLKNLARRNGAKAFESVRFSKAQIAELERTNPALAETAKLINDAMKSLGSKPERKGAKRKIAVGS